MTMDEKQSKVEEGLRMTKISTDLQLCLTSAKYNTSSIDCI